MLEIELPFPSNKLSPNARLHWGARMQHTKAAKEEAHWLTRKAMGKTIAKGSFIGPIAVAMTFYPPANHRYDRDNLQSRMKAALDGVAYALGVDDVHFRPTSDIGEKRGPHGCVMVKITPALVSVPLRGPIS